MEEFDTTAEHAESPETTATSKQAGHLKKSAVDFFRKLVVFICFGPGVLGFLWLIGRILRR